MTAQLPVDIVDLVRIYDYVDEVDALIDADSDEGCLFDGAFINKHEAIKTLMRELL